MRLILSSCGGGNGVSEGQREYAPTLAYAAVAAGCDGLFFETHPQPELALSDGPNMIKLHDMKPLLRKVTNIKLAVEDREPILTGEV